ncbi:hypothetical protein FB45DRAFT_1015823 [Roridomyces roridus]|uniref:SAP domain-containing protein n=1 Tax=Roridomyces roridus TaxID=1738132 RepID=A0AAD7F5G0_9AGAR|nr:hypothetical protein FB45DRAFT_1015823 [Roridomyces roridus]
MPKEVSGGARLLPFPKIGSYGVQVAGEWEIEHISLNVSNRQLSELCDRFKLPRSGNKSELTARLTKFSSNQSPTWNSLLPGATNPHKGHRKLNTKAKPKISELRTQQHFLEDGAVHPQAGYMSVDGQQVISKREIIRNWSSNITSKYPFKPVPPPDTQASIYTSVSHGSTTSPGTGQPGISTNTSHAGIVSLFQKFVDDHHITISATPSNLSVSAPHSSPLSDSTAQTVHEIPSDHPVATIPFVQHTQTPPELPAQLSASHSNVHAANTAFQAPSPVSGATGSAPASWRSILLAGEREVHCLTSKLPDPPLFSIADDPDWILEVWNDRFPTWKGSSPLTINGVPIPLVYWAQLYKHSKNPKWHGTRGSWFQWKVLVEAMTRTTLDDFWVRFSASDKNGVVRRLPLTRILTALTAERKEEDARLAVLAKAELPPSQLMYRKGSEWKPYQKNDALARIYRRFKGYNTEDSDDSD